MSLIYIIVGIIVLTVIWAIPSSIIAFVMKSIIKRKLSKGWCALIAAFAFYVGILLESLIIGIHKPSFLDTSIRFACVSIIFIVLYDKDLPSIFDTEKDILRKREIHKDKDAIE